MRAFALFALIVAAFTLAAPASPPNSTPDSTPNGDIPKNLYHFSVSFSEYCENGVLRARGWAGNGQTSFALNFFSDPTQKVRIPLHPGRDLLFGPYSDSQHAFGVEYDGCVWTSEGGWPCGWCEMKPWTMGPLDCQTGQPGHQRLTYRVCYFVDAHMDGLAGYGLEDSTSQRPSEETFKAIAARDELHEAPTVVNVTLDVDVAAPGPMNCDTGTPEPHRLAHVSCKFPAPFNDQIAARNTQTPPTPSPAIKKITFELASATTTPPAEFTGTLQATTVSGEVLNAEASTVTLMPAIIETAHPDARGVYTEIILPFHIQMWEYCGAQGERLAGGVYTNGNMKQSLDFKPGLMTSVAHRVPGYANLEIGPFDYKDSKLRFGYAGCEWWDLETWKSCGECRAGRWSAGPVDCKGAVPIRFKDMDCSVLLGTKP